MTAPWLGWQGEVHVSGDMTLLLPAATSLGITGSIEGTLDLSDTRISAIPPQLRVGKVIFPGRGEAVPGAFRHVGAWGAIGRWGNRYLGSTLLIPMHRRIWRSLRSCLKKPESQGSSFAEVAAIYTADQLRLAAFRQGRLAALYGAMAGLVPVMGWRSWPETLLSTRLTLLVSLPLLSLAFGLMARSHWRARQRITAELSARNSLNESEGAQNQ